MRYQAAAQAVKRFSQAVSRDRDRAKGRFVLAMRLNLSIAFDEGIDGLKSAADDAVATDLRGVLRGDGNGNRILVDVEAYVMHDLFHGCLVSFMGDEPGATNAFHSADRSAHTDNPREPTGIKHPFAFFAKP